MNKKLISIALILSMLVGMFAIMPISVGAATLDKDGDTYLIKSVSDWETFAGGSNGSYRLETDLDFSEDGYTQVKNFTGTFDGNGKTISGITMETTGEAGMFECSGGAKTIKNFVLRDSSFSGNQWVGAICCDTNANTEIENVYVSMDVSVTVENAKDGKAYAGGFVGGCGSSTHSLEITDCVFAGIVSTDGQYTGGFVGSGNSTSDTKLHSIAITNCLMIGDVSTTKTTSTRTSGFIGYSYYEHDDLSYSIVNCIYAGTGTNNYSKFADVGDLELTGCYSTSSDGVMWCDDNNGGDRKIDSEDVNVTIVTQNALIGITGDTIEGFTRRDGDVIVPTGVAEFAPITFTQQLLDGAAVRLDTPTGLRFTAVMGKAYLDSFKEEGKTVTHGIIIAPTDYIVDGEFTVDALGSVDKYLEIEAEKYVNDPEADGYYKYTGVIVKINTWNYERAFSAIAYVKVVDDETQEVTYYYSDYDEAVNSRSVAAIAEDAYNDPDGGYSDDEKDILAGFFQTGVTQ